MLQPLVGILQLCAQGTNVVLSLLQLLQKLLLLLGKLGHLCLESLEANSGQLDYHD